MYVNPSPPPKSGRVSEQTYLGSISSLHLNGLYVAALTDGKIQLRMVGVVSCPQLWGVELCAYVLALYNWIIGSKWGMTSLVSN